MSSYDDGAAMETEIVTRPPLPFLSIGRVSYAHAFLRLSHAPPSDDFRVGIPPPARRA